jgi:TruB family pseudouridylate synthase (N terminal domain)
MPRRKPRGRPLDGWLIIDKPPGLTSTDVVNRVRRAFDAQKAGHGGTLDPLATGVLPIARSGSTQLQPSGSTNPCANSFASYSFRVNGHATKSRNSRVVILHCLAIWETSPSAMSR